MRFKEWVTVALSGICILIFAYALIVILIALSNQ